MSFGQMLVHRCEILRRTEGKKGNFTTATGEAVTIATDVHCRWIHRSDSNTDTMGHVVVAEYYRLICPVKTDIQNGDIVYELDKKTGKRIGLAWTAGEVHKPNGHHLTTTLTRKGDV